MHAMTTKATKYRIVSPHVEVQARFDSMTEALYWAFTFLHTDDFDVIPVANVH